MDDCTPGAAGRARSGGASGRGGSSEVSPTGGQGDPERLHAQSTRVGVCLQYSLSSSRLCFGQRWAAIQGNPAEAF